jgi:hypothetical protein
MPYLVLGILLSVACLLFWESVNSLFNASLIVSIVVLSMAIGGLSIVKSIFKQKDVLPDEEIIRAIEQIPDAHDNAVQVILFTIIIFILIGLITAFSALVGIDVLYSPILIDSFPYGDSANDSILNGIWRALIPIGITYLVCTSLYSIIIYLILGKEKMLSYLKGQLKFY